MFDAVKIKDSCVQWIREFFLENGPDCNAVIGISGGKDSSVVAALCTEALGAGRVDIGYARMLTEFLQIRHYTVNIGESVRALTGSLPFALSKQSRINLPARIRMAALYAVAQSHNGRVANTCNLSEDWVGYATRYGDGAGDFSPCSHLTAQEVKAVGRVLGLPEILIEKPPVDGLTGRTDEENLGFTYAELDHYLRTGILDDPEVKQRIDRLHAANRFKLQIMPAFDPQIRVCPFDGI